jgi:hypothetical protein
MPCGLFSESGEKEKKIDISCIGSPLKLAAINFSHSSLISFSRVIFIIYFFSSASSSSLFHCGSFAARTQQSSWQSKHAISIASALSRRCMCHASMRATRVHLLLILLPSNLTRARTHARTHARTDAGKQTGGRADSHAHAHAHARARARTNARR